MLKKMLFAFVVACVLVAGLESCGNNPYACILIEGSSDSIHVNQPVTFSGLCSSNASSYNWQINLDSVYFTPRITLRFAAPGVQEIYLLVTNGGKSAGLVKKVTVYP